jgi:hypothetical protein
VPLGLFEIVLGVLLAQLVILLAYLLPGALNRLVVLGR